MIALAIRRAAMPMLLVLSACNAGGDDAAQQARASFERQDYITAAQQSVEALAHAPDDAELLQILARSYLAQGEGEGALRAAERFEAAGGDAQDAALLRSEALLQLGRTETAMAAVSSLQSPDAWRMRAIAAMHDGDAARADAAFAQGRRLAGDHTRLLATQAHWLIGEGRLEEAAPVVGELRRLAPERLESLFVQARLAQERGDGAAALESFEKILAKAPLDRPALLGAIAELGARGRIEEIRPLVVRARKAMPGDIEFIYLDARIAAADGNWPAVRALLQANETQVQEHPDARGLYGEALLETGNPEQARLQLAPLYRSHPEIPQIAKAYARALSVTGDEAQARAITRRLAQSSPPAG